MSCHLFNEKTGILLEHWTKLSDMPGIKVRVHILPAAYVICPIAHNQAVFAQDWREQATDEVRTTEFVSFRVHDLFDIFGVHEKQALRVQYAKISNDLTG